MAAYVHPSAATGQHDAARRARRAWNHASTESLLALGRHERTRPHGIPGIEEDAGPLDTHGVPFRGNGMRFEVPTAAPAGSSVEVEVVDICITPTAAVALTLWEAVCDWWITIPNRDGHAGWGQAVA